MTRSIRIGLIGAGANTRTRHIPGLRAIEGVEIVSVCNRRRASSEEVARAFDIPRICEHWEHVIADPDLDAVVIGTWPYLHCPITVAALKAGKHVLTEARLAMNASEAHQMLRTARAHPSLVAQVVPSPFGLKGDAVVSAWIADGLLGELREVQVFGFGAALADPAAPLSWRQDAALSGFNMLNLGILHETLLRWVAPPIEVRAQVHAHIGNRIDPQSGVRRSVGTPDSVQVLALLADGARASYHCSGVTAFGHAAGIHLYGSEGVLQYDLLGDRIRGASGRRGDPAVSAAELPEIDIPADQARSWQVEADFIAAIRDGKQIELSTFETGVAYMEFTEAVARSAERDMAVALPLEDFFADADDDS
jgi:predicted dehydrogenase